MKMNSVSAQPIFSSDPDLTPGRYMRECREASGKTIEDCAAAIALADNDRGHARNDLTLLEDDQPGDYFRLVAMLDRRKVFPFDILSFAALAAGTADASLDEFAEI